jgi:hypothetical protein
MLCPVRVNSLSLADTPSRGVIPSKNVSVIVIMCISNPLHLQSVCGRVQTKMCLFTCLWIYFLSFLFWHLLPTNYKCRGLFLCLITLKDTHTYTHTTVGRTPLDEWSVRRRELYLQKQNIHAPVGILSLRPPPPQSDRPQTRALYRAATGIGLFIDMLLN